LHFQKTRNFGLKEWLHYFPFILFALVLPLTGKINISDRVIGYGMLSVLKFPMLARSWFDTLYGYIFILQFIHASVYLIMSLIAIIKIQQEQSQLSSDNRQYTLSYLKGLLVTMGFSTISSVFFIMLLLKSQWYVREMDYIYILPLTLSVYFFSYFAMKLPLFFEKKEPIPEKYRQSNLEKEISRRQYEDLKSLILSEKLYLNPELRLMDLSAVSGVSYHQLSEVINKEAGVSFFEFINQFRVNEVLESIKSKSDQNLRINILEIAYSAGFNNKVSFNRYFKKKTGMTPTSFIKNDLKRG
jgi:AraC-like DNA-binding protein